MHKTVFPGQLINIDHGHLTLKVVAVFENRVIVECLNDFEMTKSLTMTIPDAKTNAPIFSEKEMSILLDFVATNPEIEFVSLPRVRNAADVSEVKRQLSSIDRDGKIKLLSKIQSRDALQNFEAILDISDGFKVDKDCLDLTLTPEKVFIAQKYMTEKANMADKLVITSTEMFQSMEVGA